MNEEMRSRELTFRAVKIDGGGEVAWTQWIAESPDGEIEGWGLYKVENGLMTYYRDYMNAPSISNDN